MRKVIMLLVIFGILSLNSMVFASSNSSSYHLFLYNHTNHADDDDILMTEIYYLKTMSQDFVKVYIYVYKEKAYSEFLKYNSDLVDKTFPELRTEIGYENITNAKIQNALNNLITKKQKKYDDDELERKAVLKKLDEQVSGQK